MSSLASRDGIGAGAAEGRAAASYDPIIKFVHWATVALLALMFATVWAAQSASARESHEALLQLHRSLGVTLFAVTLFRLGWRLRTHAPRLPEDLSAVQVWAARAVQAALYLLLLAQPALGYVHSNAHGNRVDFFFLVQLPAVVGRDKWLAKQTLAVHETVAIALLALIALHAAAALFHHFVRGDDVLRTMLPRRR